MDNFYLEIGSPEAVIAFLQATKEKTGLLKSVPLREVEQILQTKSFPIKVPVDLDAVIELASNPILKKAFGKKLEYKAAEILVKAMGSG